MMKKPSGGAITMQEQSDAGINPFAVQLLAESYADKPERFGERTMLVVGRSHKGAAVYMIIGTTRPELEQFDGWPE